MPNIASILKDEIARIARKEIRAETERLKKASTQYRSEIAALKRQVVDLQREVTRLSNANGAAKAAATAEDGIDVSKLRWSPAKLTRHRERLDLSYTGMGIVLNATGQSVKNWEDGARPGKVHLAKIAQLRTLSKRQARAIVDTAKTAVK